MKLNKVTVGYVVQTFEGQTLVSQEFIAGDDVTYEDLDGNILSAHDDVYHSFDMVVSEES